jgi:hypothetical protein
VRVSATMTHIPITTGSQPRYARNRCDAAGRLGPIGRHPPASAHVAGIWQAGSAEPGATGPERSATGPERAATGRVLCHSEARPRDTRDETA